MIKSLFKRHTICLQAVICVLIAGLGFGGWHVCVRENGEFSVKSLYGHRDGCCVGNCVGSFACSDADREMRSFHGFGHENCLRCFRVPVVMVASSRSPSLNQLPSASNTELRCPVFEIVSLSPQRGGLCSVVPLSCLVAHPSFERLQSTVLLM